MATTEEPTPVQAADGPLESSSATGSSENESVEAAEPDDSKTSKVQDNSEPEKIQWPVKTRDLHNHHHDSTMWDDFAFRDDDIVIATYAKSGTTWTQQIVGQLLFKGDPNVQVGQMSPWVDLRVPPKEIQNAALEAQTHRRFFKTHLPVDALNFSPKAKYIYVARDGRDVLWSLHNHHSSASAKWYGALNKTPGLVGAEIPPPNPDVKAYYEEWIAKDGYPFWSFWENVQSWWAIRHLPNVYMIHFNDLKRDMEGEMRLLAEFLEIDIDETKWADIVEHSTYDWMREHGSQIAPLGGALWEGGANSFFHKGTNGRWRDILTAEDCQRYEQLAEEKLGAECAAWLKHGDYEPRKSQAAYSLRMSSLSFASGAYNEEDDSDE